MEAQIQPNEQGKFDDLIVAVVFSQCVEERSIDRVGTLLRLNPSLARAHDEQGIPLVFYLHTDIARLEEMIQVLVAHGADLNARDKDGRTLLDRALARGLTDFADMLRAHGATSHS